jgi:hypothetical protein
MESQLSSAMNSQLMPMAPPMTQVAPAIVVGRTAWCDDKLRQTCSAKYCISRGSQHDMGHGHQKYTTASELISSLDKYNNIALANESLLYMEDTALWVPSHAQSPLTAARFVLIPCRAGYVPPTSPWSGSVYVTCSTRQLVHSWNGLCYWMPDLRVQSMTLRPQSPPRQLMRYVTRSAVTAYQVWTLQCGDLAQSWYSHCDFGEHSARAELSNLVVEGGACGSGWRTMVIY